MKIKVNNSNFEPCPEFTGKAVCVDVTPPRRQQSQFGERDVIKVVFEVDLDREDGSRYCVWSRNITPTLNEKSNLRKLVRGWFGRDLTKAELEDFDTESLIGKPAQLVVVQEHKDGETYANIMACVPDRSGGAAEAERQIRSVQGQKHLTPALSPERRGGGGRRRPALFPERPGRDLPPGPTARQRRRRFGRDENPRWAVQRGSRWRC